MIKNLSFLVVGFIAGAIITAAYAKVESGSLDARSIVGYGNNSGVIVPIQVDSQGVVQLQ